MFEGFSDNGGGVFVERVVGEEGEEAGMRGGVGVGF